MFASIGRLIAKHLNRPISDYERYAAVDPESLRRTFRPGDVLLVEGDTRFSVAIKYLTQSTWSHVCLFVGDRVISEEKGPEPCLIEADIIEGVRLVPFDAYIEFNIRVCRPHGLTSEDTTRVVDYAMNRLGQTYDLKNIFDLARYLIPLPIPVTLRSRALALGSGNPTKVICSAMIAEAFQSVAFPILPRMGGDGDAEGCFPSDDAVLCRRHHTFFTPRDFDVSPYFQTIKPTIEQGFDYKSLNWAKP